jgi:aromatic ring-cleaving dioxygenase
MKVNHCIENTKIAAIKIGCHLRSLYEVAFGAGQFGKTMPSLLIGCAEYPKYLE